MKGQVMVKIIMFVLLCAIPTFAQQQLTKDDFLKPRKLEIKALLKDPVMLAGTLACFAGTTADLLSSRGPEANPLLRDSQGNISKSRAAFVAYGVCGAMVVLYRWKPGLAKLLGFVAGGAHIGAAIHNARLR
jgi:hypothetical protein